MKKYLFITLTLILLILAFTFIPALNESSFNPFQKKSITLKSVESIETINISEYRSSSYSYKALFPYDFIIGEPNWGTVLYKNERFLTLDESLNRQFYLDCKKIGIDLYKGNHFFIIKVIATAGINLDEYLKNSILNIEEDSKKITLKTPSSQILSLEVVDDLKEDNFPDINITPREWKELITLLLPRIEEEIIARGLILSSEKTSRLFIEKIFSSIGWESIEFK